MITRKSSIVEGAAVGVATDDPFDDGLHEAFLEVEGGLHTDEGHAQQGVAHGFGEPRGEAFEQQ